MKRIFNVILATTLTFAFTSCSEKIEVNNSPEVELPGIYLENDYLVFPSNIVFQETIELLRNMDGEEIIDWESQFNSFVSLRGVYEEAIEEDLKLFSNPEKLSNEQIESLKNDVAIHSDFVNMNRSLFVFDQKGEISINIYRYELAPLVNKYGLVKVGNYFQQHTFNYMKVMDGRKSLDTDLIRNKIENNNSIGLKVNKVQHLDVGNKGLTNERTSFNGSCVGFAVGCCSDAWVEGTVTLSVVSTPGYGYLPCSYPECYGQPCFLSQCEVITGYNQTQTYQISSKSREKKCIIDIFGITFICWNGDTQRNHTLSGSYRQNGILKTYFHQTFSKVNFLKTLYTGPVVDFTNGFHTFETEKSSTSVSHLCTVNFF